MNELLKKLFEDNSVVSQEVMESIEKAWNDKIMENRTQVAQQLREEFAQKYEHDKGVMVEAVDQMLNEQLAHELAEFADDRRQLAEAKVKYAKKIKKDAQVMKEFVTRQLANEVRELHEDQVQMADKFHKLENFVLESLAGEITEFYQDKQDVADTKVRLIREGREEIKRVRDQFIKRASKIVESTVNQNLYSEITSLKEDIDAARRQDFGRKLFEAFAAEYQTSYLNERSETSKLLKQIDLKDLAIQEAAQAVVEAEQALESKDHEIKMLKESFERQKIMGELLAPLNRESQAIMSELLETVKTNKLNESFERYLPAVVAGKSTQRKQTLTESKAVTGNREENKTISEDESNIIAIRRLAGLQI